MYPAQQNATDQTSNFMWLLMIITGLLLAAWWLVPQWFVIPIYWFRYYELDFFQHIVSAWDSFALWATWLHLPHGKAEKLVALQHYILNTNPRTESFKNFAILNDQVGAWLRWLSAPILGLSGIITYFKFANRRFTRIYSMDSLKQAEKTNWPQITPVLSLDLVKEDLEKGPWAMAQLPLAFCKKHDLVSVIESKSRQVWKVERGGAFRVFTAQLGPLWKGVHALPIHMKALIVVFLARAERERDVASTLLSQISASAAGGKLDFTNVEKQLEKYQSSRVIKWLENKHAYVYTLLASMLEIARADGVLATAEFLWLKPVDRRLWYVLNSVGRQTSVVEVAGPYSHWLTEKKLKRALETPMVKDAVDALEENMLDTLYDGEDATWHTYNAA